MNAVHRLMERGVLRHFPHACLLVARDGQPLIHQAFGRARLETIFDVASLTKPLAATAAAMQLIADGALRVGDPVRRWVPEVDRPETRALRVSHLLDHSSGLPAWSPLYQQVAQISAPRRRHAVRRRVAVTPLEAPSGQRPVYSDLGFILLDWVLQRCSGQRLDRLAARRVYAPLGLSRTSFVDLAREPFLPPSEFAPTERCPWRGRRLRAEVHDDNCHSMGGISGHAGLFSTAYEIHLLARELHAAHRGRRSIFETAVVRRFFAWRRPPDSTRCLGWDTPSPEGSSSGRLFSPHSVGHLGFTGTSLWIDLERSIWVILLTNRVHPGREPNPMKAFRPRLHDTIMRELCAKGTE